jgi:hypothetical protein
MKKKEMEVKSTKLSITRANLFSRVGNGRKMKKPQEKVDIFLFLDCDKRRAISIYLI